MTVFLAAPPAGGGALIGPPVAHLLARDARYEESLLGGAAAAHSSAPMALYTVGLHDAASGRALAAAAPTGWRYLIVGGAPQDAPIAVADLRADAAGGASRFDSLIRGRLAQRLNEAASLAYKLYGTQKDGFEARVLEIPAIYRTALWLHGPSDVFFPVLEAGKRDTEPVEQDDLFLTRIRDEARQRTAVTDRGEAVAG